MSRGDREARSEERPAGINRRCRGATTVAPTTTTNAPLWGSTFGLTLAERRVIVERFSHPIYLGPDNNEPENWDVLAFLRHHQQILT